MINSLSDLLLESVFPWLIVDSKQIGWHNDGDDDETINFELLVWSLTDNEADWQLT